MTLFLTSCGGGNGDGERPVRPDASSVKALSITPAAAALAQWTSPISLPLIPVTGAVLASGKLLFFAADAPNNITYSGGGHTYASVYDPATGNATLNNVTSSGQDAFCTGTARLPDGRLLVNGGDNAGISSLYDPATDTWSAAGSMNTARGYNASVPLADGSVLTVGGSWNGGQGAKASEVWTAAAGWRSLPGITTADPTMLTADGAGIYRSDNHMWLLPTGNGKVLHAGPSSQMHWLDATGNGSTAPAGPRADDSDSMNGNAVMYSAGKILTVGGAVNYDGGVGKSSAYIIDTTQFLAPTRRIASMAYGRLFHNSVVLPNGQVVIMGGQTNGVGFSDANGVLVPELFDPQTETFTTLPAMSVARNYHSIGLLMLDGRVVSAGGGLCNCAGDHLNMQILSPPYLFNADGSAATRPVLMTAPTTVGYGSQAAVTTDSAVTAFSMIRLGAATHTVNNDQRRVEIAFTAQGNNTWQLVIPTNPGILMPGQWMLFAMNANGTPSVAKIVTVSGSGAPVITNPGTLTTVVGGSVSVAVSASTASGTLTFSATGLPAGLVINSASGILSGTPTTQGYGVATLMASNGAQTTTTDIAYSVGTAGTGTGTGLQAQYFSGNTFTGAPIGNTGNLEVPNLSTPSGNALSARWTGYIEPTATGVMQLQALSAQGVRVWLNNNLVIDTLSNPAPTSDTGSMIAYVGQRYALLVEYAMPSGPGNLTLNWRPAGAPSLVPVPMSRLYPSTSPVLSDLALNKTATQASTYGTATANLAVDGNTNGVFSSGSVSHTGDAAPQDWWQVDLGTTSRIDMVQIWNRTDCCATRLQNVNVLSSPTDMTGRTLTQLQADPTVVSRTFGASVAAPNIDVPIGAQGRFVRVQLSGNINLHMAEVVVMGINGSPPVLGSTATSQQGSVGVATSLGFSATDPQNLALTYSAAGLPPGLGISAATGTVSGTPTTGGSFNVTLTATDSAGLATSATFLWTVTAPLPQVTALPAPVVASGSTVSYNPTLSAGASATYSWNFGDGSAATTPSASAASRYTYAAAGVYTVALTITASDGRTATRRFYQAVYPSGPSAVARASSSVMIEPRTGTSSRIWAVNPDNNSVTVFDATSYAKLAEIAVGNGPRTLALSGYGPVWVTNHDSASVSIIDTGSLTVTSTVALARGSQPYGIVFSPADGSAFITLEATGQLVRYANGVPTVIGVGSNPRHLSISAAGDRILLSRFITRPLLGEGSATVTTTDANGNKLGGEVLVINPSTLAVTSTVVLAHSEKLDLENQGRGIPNYLAAAAISPDGKSAWVPSKQDNIKRGALRDGNSLNFQNTVRSISSRIDLTTLAEDYPGRVDHDNAGVASAAVYHPTGAYLFVALETNRQIAVLDPAGKRELFRFEVGFAPQGVAVSADGLKLVVNNFMSRSVSVIDLTPLMAQGQSVAPALATLSTVATDALPAAVLRGKQLFYDARDTRLARDSYMSCATCHADAGHDGRTWDFTSQGEGLRNTIALKGRSGMGHGLLHWSGNFDEVQDFEGQIRTLSGGTGLMSDADFNTGTRSQPLGDKKAGISADLDALAAYMASLHTMPSSPYRNQDGTLTAAASAGKTVFTNQNCASCHGGPAFTGSADGATRQNIGTLKPSSGQRLYGTLDGIDTPTLRDVWATAPYLHDGSAPTLTAAVQAHNNVTLNPTDLANVVEYLRQIGGDETAPGAADVATNLALGKTATQSSVVLSAWPSRAVDGNTSGDWYQNSVTHTDNTSPQPWWQVDLGTQASIDSIRLWNRTDCCSSRLSSFVVFVSSTDMTGRTLAQLSTDPAVQQWQVVSMPGPSLTLPASSRGRFVRVQLMGQDYLSLAEVQVFGTPQLATTNLALGKAATQSSEINWGNAARAVDGNTIGDWYQNSVTHTDNTAPQPWWQVDLGSTAALGAIRLWNRTDCCASRLSNFTVFVSTMDMSARTLAQLAADPTVTQMTVATLNGAPSLTLALNAIAGRYVRVQLNGQDYLSLAEVQVFGVAWP